jgi:hypothetical protein
MSTETNAESTKLNTEEEKVDYYSDLSSADLAKQINEDYSVILGSERANLPRALAIAPKLHVLRVRAWGQWKTKFPSYGLTISYETASVYLRVWEHWHEIQTLAAKKGADPTLLTIDGARELWARRKATDEPDSPDSSNEENETKEDDVGSGGGKPTPEAMKARETANAEAEAKALAEDESEDDAETDAGIKSIGLDLMFAQLMQVYSQDELMGLTERLAKHLGMTLMPLATTEALMRELGAPSDVAAPVA